MTLRRKTLLIIGITIISLIVIISFASQEILMSSFEQLEQNEMHLNVERFSSAILDNISNISSTVSDWAYWDDTVDFIEGSYPEYIDDNLSGTTLENLQLNFMLFINSSGEMHYGFAVDLQSGEDLPISDELLQYISDYPTLIFHPDAESISEGLILAGETPILVASRPILNSDQEDPPHGALIMGRFLDDQEIQFLSETVQVSANIFRLNQPPLPEDVQLASVNLSPTDPIYVNPLDTVTIAGYVQLTDVTNNPLLIARIDTPRNIYDQGRTSVRYFIISLVLFGLIFTIISIILLERGILSRLSTITTSVNEIRKSGNISDRIDISGEDELSTLSNNINRMLDTIQQSSTQLEERTSELEESTKQVIQRATQLEAIADVSRTIATIQSLEELLTIITKVVSKRFDFYHVGIFLLDDNDEFAILRAANSPGGQRMLARGHRLRVGSEGIVGYATGRRKARIALDTGADAIFFNNPELPETRSEVALPLSLGDEIIGALDIQSTQANAFSNEEIVALTVLADQLAIAIKNAQSLEQARLATTEAEAVASQLIGQAWSTIREKAIIKGVHFDGLSIQPLDQSSGTNPQNNKMISIPIRLRNESIGNLSVIHPETGKSWRSDEIEIFKSIAERIALAAENARLLEASQRQVAKERLISEGTTRVSAGLDVESVLQTTAIELERVLGGAEVIIQLENEE